MSERMGAKLTTKPTTNGEVPLAKRDAPKGLLPVSWTGRTVRIAYTDARGDGVETSGTLLDTFAAGPVFNLNGVMALLLWERITLIELQPDR